MDLINGKKYKVQRLCMGTVGAPSIFYTGILKKSYSSVFGIEMWFEDGTYINTGQDIFYEITDVEDENEK